MPTNANVFNSRVTSEALEKKFRDTFPSQGGAELVQDLFASGVIVPTVDFTAAAEGSALPDYLQTAWDFATDFETVNNGTQTLTSTPGFWLVDVNVTINPSTTVRYGQINLSDGLTTNVVWRFSAVDNTASATSQPSSDETKVIFVRSGDTLSINATAGAQMNANFRQIADVNGNLVNPLGFVST